MAVRCPACGSDKVVKIGRYDWFIKWSLGGILVLGVAGFFAQGLWLLVPLWMLGVLFLYITRPLYGCEECKNEWDPRRNRATG